MMAVINVAAFLMMTVVLAHRAKEKLVDVLPGAVSLLVLLLYGLAFFRALSLIDLISIICMAGFGVWVCKGTGRNLKQYLFHPGAIVVLLLIVLVSVLVKDKVVTWWDDYNFWAADAKALYYLGGFPEKYGNVAPEFGDYPPGIQLIKWYFLHFFPNEYREGMLFAGYYSMNLAFLAPLLRNLNGKNIIISALCGLGLWLFPSMAEVFYFDGACADLTMAIVYGSFLTAVLDREGHKEWFYYLRLILYLSVLMLTKNVGFMWAGFGLLFLLGNEILNKKEEGKLIPFRKIIPVVVIPALIEGSWLLFCYLMRRVAKLTGAAVSMAAGGVNLPDYADDLVRTFFTAFVQWPLHRWKTWAIDFTPVTMVVFIFAALYLLYRRKAVDKRRAGFIAAFLLISAVVFYGINLAGHLTIFALETQYLEPYAMVSSIARYGAPFTVGSLYLLTYLVTGSGLKWGSGGNGRFSPFWVQYGGYLIWILVVFVSADHNSAYRSLIGYRKTVDQELQVRSEMIAGNGERFLQSLREEEHLAGRRVLLIQNGKTARWVGNTYLNYEASPISVVHSILDAEALGMELTQELMPGIIMDYHGDYLYVTSESDDIKTIFEAYTGEAFEFNTLYEIRGDQAGVCLKKVKQQ